MVNGEREDHSLIYCNVLEGLCHETENMYMCNAESIMFRISSLAIHL